MNRFFTPLHILFLLALCSIVGVYRLLTKDDMLLMQGITKVFPLLKQETENSTSNRTIFGASALKDISQLSSSAMNETSPAIPLEAPVLDSFVLFSAYIPSDGSPEIPVQYHCQVNNHFSYASRHGYDYFAVVDASDEWEQEKKKYNLDVGWFKVFVLRRFLAQKRHEWVQYLDMDSVFMDADVNLSSIVSNAPKTASIVLPDDKGWNTNVVFIRNTKSGRNFIERVWELREKYNNCVREQCAFHAALQEAMAEEDAIISGSGKGKSLTVRADRGKTCCEPIKQHQRNDNSAQGCMWNWLFATKAREQNNLYHNIYWSKAYPTLNLKHPVKEMACGDMKPLLNRSLVPIGEPEPYHYNPVHQVVYISKTVCKVELIGGNTTYVGGDHE